MLLRFSATNYKSLYHTQELSMVAQSEQRSGSGNPSLLHETSGTQVVPYALIYGANASGKSNLIASLSFLRMAIIASHLGGTIRTAIPRHPFLLAPSAVSEPSELEIDFIVEGKRYNYGFKASEKQFLEEWLYVFPTKRNRAVRLFHRYEEGSMSFGPNLKGPNKTIEQFLRKNSLFLSVAAQNNHPILTSIYKFFISLNFKNMTDQSDFYMAPEVADAQSFDFRILKFLTEIGTGVTEVKLKYTKRPEDQKSRILELLNALDEAEELEEHADKIDLDVVSTVELGRLCSNGDVVYFDFEVESSGTRGLLKLLTSIFRTLDDGGILVVDEIDASVHTQVAEAILELFANQNSNPHGAQLIATTHDTNLLCSDTIKRDQIWFAEKNLSGETVIFPLTDFKPREGDNFQKGYLKGRFGAIPFSGNLSGLFKTETVI